MNNFIYFIRENKKTLVIAGVAIVLIIFLALITSSNKKLEEVKEAKENTEVVEEEPEEVEVYTDSNGNVLTLEEANQKQVNGEKVGTKIVKVSELKHNYKVYTKTVINTRKTYNFNTTRGNTAKTNGTNPNVMDLSDVLQGGNSTSGGNSSIGNTTTEPEIPKITREQAAEAYDELFNRAYALLTSSKNTVYQKADQQIKSNTKGRTALPGIFSEVVTEFLTTYENQALAVLKYGLENYGFSDIYNEKANSLQNTRNNYINDILALFTAADPDFTADTSGILSR
jgi:biopolymer transport protein ExbD